MDANLVGISGLFPKLGVPEYARACLPRCDKVDSSGYRVGLVL